MGSLSQIEMALFALLKTTDSTGIVQAVAAPAPFEENLRRPAEFEVMTGRGGPSSQDRGAIQ
jgi:hypothetical protein